MSVSPHPTPRSPPRRVLEDATGRRLERMRWVGRAVALLFLVWLALVILGGLGVNPVRRLPLGHALRPSSGPPPARHGPTPSPPAPADLVPALPAPGPVPVPVPTAPSKPAVVHGKSAVAPGHAKTTTSRGKSAVAPGHTKTTTVRGKSATAPGHAKNTTTTTATTTTVPGRGLGRGKHP